MCSRIGIASLADKNEDHHRALILILMTPHSSAREESSFGVLHHNMGITVIL